MEDIEEVMKLFPRGGTHVKKLLIVKNATLELAILHVYVLPNTNKINTWQTASPLNMYKNCRAIRVFGPTVKDGRFIKKHKWFYVGPWQADFKYICRIHKEAALQREEIQENRDRALLENY